MKKSTWIGFLAALALVFGITACGSPATNYYSVTYMTEYGTAPAKLEVEEGTILTAEQLPAITAEGYVFDGWYQSGFKAEADKLQVNSDITLTAKWKVKVIYSTEHGTAPEAITVEPGTTLYLAELKAISAEGYTFAGWYNGETKVEAGTLKVTKEVTLTAKWSLSDYAVTFDAKNGSEATKKVVAHGSKVTAPEDPVKETKNSVSYTFAGWYTSTDSGQTLAATVFDFEKTEITSEITLYAKWNESYVVTFDTNDGTEVASQTIKSGEKATKPATDPTKSALGLTTYTFANWYTSTDEGLTLSDTAFDFTKETITAPTTLYAKWTSTTAEYQFHSTPTTLDAGTDGTAGTTGTYVEFGDWPQTAKSSAVTIDTKKTKTMGGFTYYKGNDGYWYAKFENDNSYPRVIYYKVEAIKWRVLTENYNGKKLLLAENVLTNCAFYDTSNDRDGPIYPNNYRHSRIRAFLNGKDYLIDTPTASSDGTVTRTTSSCQDLQYKGFLQSAFDGQGSVKIASIDVDGNSAMNDKIFLLSKDEVENSAYGFANDTSRKHKITDYSKVVGVNSDAGYGAWWLRTPFDTADSSALFVMSSGSIQDTTGQSVDYEKFGVVPALCLNPTE